jgi:3-dehydroquinate synthase
MSEKIDIKSKIRNYEVDIVDDFMSSLKLHDRENNFYLIDTKVRDIYKEKITQIFPSDNIFNIIAVEDNKNLDYCQYVIKELIKKEIRKNCTIVAIGGGITQDIAAFIGSILFRGISWEFYPTTLLAQADSCIGSKTSINLGAYKNLVGTFYPPARINIDTNFLNTLTIDDIKSGIGEMLHYYLIAGCAETVNLIGDYDKLTSDRSLFKKYILTSLAIKKGFIESDEFDTNERNILNYGHTFGHAIEAISGYKVNHGQAVTMGMDIANYISRVLDYMDKKTFDKMHQILYKNMPDFSVKKDDFDMYFKALAKDKKNLGKDLVCILSRKPGSMLKVRLPFNDALKNSIMLYFNDPQMNAISGGLT